MATTKPRTDLDFEFFRARLTEEKTLALSTISGTRSAEGGTSGTGRTESSDSDDNNDADLATDLFFREEDRTLEKNAQAILSQIDRALGKIEDGTYGLSDISGAPIPKERLEAIPYATLTADEQENRELS